MKLPQLTRLSNDLRRESIEDRRRSDNSQDRSIGIIPSGECGCEHHCIGPCVLGNCLGTCTPI